MSIQTSDLAQLKEKGISHHMCEHLSTILATKEISLHVLFICNLSLAANGVILNICALQPLQLQTKARSDDPCDF